MNKNEQFIFFGSARFAEIFLAEIIQNAYRPHLVICNPDRPLGRKKILTAPPAKTLAEKKGIPVLQPEKLNADNVPAAPFGIVAAYGKIIPKSVLEKFPHGILCIHPSLLPKYRGATPIQSALLAGEKETGTTLFVLDEKVDHGPIIADIKIPIEENDDYYSLEEKLARGGAAIFLKSIGGYLAGTQKPHEQNHAAATLTEKFVRENAFIPEKIVIDAENGKDAFSVARKIKAFAAEPGAWTLKNGKEVKLLACTIRNEKLVLTKTQRAGKKPQTNTSV